MDEKVPTNNIIETEIPMGTVHPAALEPYRVRFFVEDEIIQEAEITIGVNHRGIERIMEGLPVQKANSLTEKICGICSNAHICNSCRTAETGLGIEIPQRGVYIRVIMGELENILLKRNNHGITCYGWRKQSSVWMFCFRWSKTKM